MNHPCHSMSRTLSPKGSRSSSIRHVNRAIVLFQAHGHNVDDGGMVSGGAGPEHGRGSAGFDDGRCGKRASGYRILVEGGLRACGEMAGIVRAGKAASYRSGTDGDDVCTGVGVSIEWIALT